MSVTRDAEISNRGDRKRTTDKMMKAVMLGPLVALQKGPALQHSRRDSFNNM